MLCRPGKDLDTITYYSLVAKLPWTYFYLKPEIHIFFWRLNSAKIFFNYMYSLSYKYNINITVSQILSPPLDMVPTEFVLLDDSE